VEKSARSTGRKAPASASSTASAKEFGFGSGLRGLQPKLVVEVQFILCLAARGREWQSGKQLPGASGQFSESFLATDNWMLTTGMPDVDQTRRLIG
jgi:hypothetical protein